MSKDRPANRRAIAAIFLTSTALILVAIAMLLPYISGAQPLPWQCSGLASYRIVSADGSARPIVNNGAIQADAGARITGIADSPGLNCYAGLIMYSPAENSRKVVDYKQLPGDGQLSLETGTIDEASLPAERTIEIVFGNLYCGNFLSDVSQSGNAFSVIPDDCKVVVRQPVRLVGG